jgi:Fic family protein
VREVSNYVDALEYGLAQLHERPLSLDLIRELHGRLMKGVRGHDRSAGEFRKVQNWIGPPRCPLENARYVPPPPGKPLLDGLRALEVYLNKPTELPKLVRAALVHAQFEAIHPFVDGNGRIGRLLISLLLCRDQLLAQPLLSLSAYFERNRREYYDHLLSVSTQGTWEYWTAFVLLGVRDEALDALKRAERLLALRDHFRQTVQKSKAPARVLDLVDHLFDTPIVRVADVHRIMKVNPRTALSYVDKLVALGIVQEITGKRRDRLFAANRIIRTIE